MHFRLFTDNILLIQYLIRLGILLVLSLQVFSLSRLMNRKGNLWMLTLLLLAIPVYLNDNEVFQMLQIDVSRRMNIILYLPVVCIPMCSYLAVQYFINPEKRLDKGDFFLFFPWLIDWFITIPVIINPDLSAQWSRWDVYSFVSNYFLRIFYTLYSFYLWYKAYQLVKEHTSDVKLIHATTERVDLKWLYGFALCIPILFISHLLRETFDYPILFDIGDLLAMGVILFLGINVVQQREVFPEGINLKTLKEEVATEVISSIEVVQKNKLIQTQSHELEELMRLKRPHLNPNLNLGDLAFLLDIRPQELSQLLNTHFSTNFYSYINKYRIETCKEMLADPQYTSLSMEGIASKAGFKSKSTFYTRFKEFTGLTPLQYIDKINLSD